MLLCIANLETFNFSQSLWKQTVKYVAMLAREYACVTVLFHHETALYLTYEQFDCTGKHRTVAHEQS